MYRLIADDLRQQIESGMLSPGRQLPTELELRDSYNASRHTVQSAIRWLTGLGLVETRTGVGAFVALTVDPFIITLSTDAEGRGGGEGATYLSEITRPGPRRAVPTMPRIEIQKASGEIAAWLQLDEQDLQVISRHEKRFIDHIPWSIQTSFYPRKRMQGADRLLEPDDIEEGVVRYLARSLGLRQVGYRDSITVRTPNPIETEFFNLPEDGRVGVFEVFRTAYDQDSVPMRLTVTTYPVDRNRFIVNVGQVPPMTAPSPY
jgi:GntR family transcriptional regulator